MSKSGEKVLRGLKEAVKHAKYNDVREALLQCVGVLEAMRGDFVEPYYNQRLKALTHAYAALGIKRPLEVQ